MVRFYSKWHLPITIKIFFDLALQSSCTIRDTLPQRNTDGRVKSSNLLTKHHSFASWAAISTWTLMRIELLVKISRPRRKSDGYLRKSVTRKLCWKIVVNSGFTHKFYCFYRQFDITSHIYISLRIIKSHAPHYVPVVSFFQLNFPDQLCFRIYKISSWTWLMKHTESIKTCILDKNLTKEWKLKFHNENTSWNISNYI